MATSFGAKLADQHSFSTLAFRNGLKYRNIDERRYLVYKSGELLSTNPGNYDSRNYNFLDDAEKSSCLRITQKVEDIYQIFRVGTHMGGNDLLLVLWSPTGRCYCVTN